MIGKLGKNLAIKDRRNIKFLSIVDRAILPAIPDTWDADKQFTFTIPEPPFGNLDWGCCVMADRAHQTLRFDAKEQGRALNILESQVLDEYWREQGGDSRSKPDNGLNILDSLKIWRNRGWLSRNYNIYAFAEINYRLIAQVKAAMFLLNGVSGGVVLHQSDMDQVDKGQPWSITSKPGNIVGGHALYWKAFTPKGIVCVT